MKKSGNTSLTDLPLRNNQEELVKLMVTYNPSEQMRFSCYPERCVTGSAPTLAKVAEQYGIENSLKWIVLQLNDFCNSIAFKEENKPQLVEMKQIARLMFNRYFHLKLSEVMLFFNNLKCGDYGALYGRLDVIQVFNALNKFMKQRGSIIDKIDKQEQERKRIAAKKNAISYQEYLARKAKKENKTI